MPINQTKATVADWGRMRLNPTSPLTLTSLKNDLELDLIQVINEGGLLVYNVTWQGVAQLLPNQTPFNPPTGTGGFYTNQVLFRKYYTRVKDVTVPPLTAAEIFLDVFSENNTQADIIDIISQGDAPVFHVDYLGAAFYDTNVPLATGNSEGHNIANRF